MEHFKMFIGGEFVDAKDGRTMQCLDPGTGQPIATVPSGRSADADAAVKAARQAFDSGVWSNLSLQERSEIIMEWADLVDMETMRLTMYESQNCGAPISGVGGSLWVAAMTIRNLAWYATNKFPWREELKQTGSIWAWGTNTILREPVGVCVGIVPWNTPATSAVWKIAHAIAMGNTIVLKPASDTPLSALVLAETVAKSRIPKGVINVVTGPGGELGEALCQHPLVDKISFTGSTEVGKRIMALGSETVKKVTLELGGKSANIVLEDADIDSAVDGALVAIFYNSGQICISGSRLLLHRSIYDQFVEKLKKRVADIKLGYQLMPDTRFGPLNNARHLAKVEQYVAVGKSEGARLICGGKRHNLPGFEGGFYYEPTIFADVNNKMRIAREEIFGPVLCVIPFKDEDEAVHIANDTPYGLAGGIWSQDISRAQKLAGRIRTGTMWINDCNILSDYAPFGGYKQSGVGKEFGYEGLAGFTQTKLLYTSPEGSPDRATFGGVFTYPPGDTFSYWGPTKLNCGPGSVSTLGKEIDRLGGRRAVIITDKGLVAAGVVDTVRKAAGDYCVGVFDGVEPDTGHDIVDQAAEMCRDLKADCVVSLGGGSSMDTAKVAAICVTLGGKAIENTAIMRLAGPPIPHIAIPTTHGTGSEVTAVAVILNKKLKKKGFCSELYMIPSAAILDAKLAVGLPRSMSAGTSMDAFAHAIEAVLSAKHNPISTAMALEAVRRIKKYLPMVMENGKDLRARHQMLVASTMAGWGLAGATSGITHALAHTIGGLYGIHHGTACGIALPHAMRFNRDYCLPRMVLVAEALGVDTRRMSEVEAADAAIDTVSALLKQIGSPTKFSELKVPMDALQQILMGTLTDLSMYGNPRPTSDPTPVVDMIKGSF
jgi:acyl-CoA reductase-like NAD-dependent aldehyde dehydrogenase/alcohol dehydrogenase class IV